MSGRIRNERRRLSRGGCIRSFPLVTLIKQLPEMLVPMVGVVAVCAGRRLGMLLLAVGGLLAVVLAFQVLAWWRFTYTLLPNEMYIESGIFSRNRRSIPWERVQDVEIERGPLARVLVWPRSNWKPADREVTRGCSIRLRSPTRWRCATRSGRGGGSWLQPPHRRRPPSRRCSR